MKSNKIKTLSQTALILACVTIFSSCNRGVGCPNNFSIQDIVETFIQLF